MEIIWCLLLGCVLCAIHAYTSVVNKFYLNYVTRNLGFIRDLLVYKFRDTFISIFKSGKTSFNEKNQTMELVYYKDSVKYKIATPAKKGLRPIKNIALKSCDILIDIQEDQKIIENIHQFMGPYGNFHGIPITPKMMGSDRPLLVTYRNNKVKEYDVNDVIELRV